MELVGLNDGEQRAAKAVCAGAGAAFGSTQAHKKFAAPYDYVTYERSSQILH